MSQSTLVRKLGAVVVSCRSLRSPVLTLQRVGRGCDGDVYRAEDTTTGEIFALKKPSSTRARRASLSPEGRALAEEIADLCHENVLDYKPGLDNGDTVMEYVDGGTVLGLVERNGRLGEEHTATIVEQVLRGLLYLHSRGVVHKDIKPSNLLIDSKRGKIKVSDMAGIRENDQRGLRVPVGTPVFLAPEVLRTGDHAPVSDIWSVGCSALQCLTGNLPWDEEDTAFSAMFKVGNGQHPPIPPHLSPVCRHFLQDCFEVDPSLRPSAVELLDSPFLRQHKQPYRFRARSWAGPDDAFLAFPSALTVSLNDE